MLPFVYLLTPYTSLFPTENGRLAALMAVMVLKAFAIIVAFPSTTILLTNSCTSLRVLGTLNGFATAFGGLARGLGPGLTGLAFTWGAGHGYIVSAYFFLCLFAIVGAVPAFMIVEGDGPAAEADASDAEDNDAPADAPAPALLPSGSAAVDSSDDDGGRGRGDASSPLLGRTGHKGATYQAISGSRPGRPT